MSSWQGCVKNPGNIYYLNYFFLTKLTNNTLATFAGCTPPLPNMARLDQANPKRDGAGSENERKIQPNTLWNITCPSSQHHQVGVQSGQQLSDVPVQIWEEIPQGTICLLIRIMPQYCQTDMQTDMQMLCSTLNYQEYFHL